MSLLEAKVKSVLSGDTIILHNLNNPRQERTLSLAYVTSPRLRREGDEVSRQTLHTATRFLGTRHANFKERLMQQAVPKEMASDPDTLVFLGPST